jgi:hypothetical protein
VGWPAIGFWTEPGLMRALIISGAGALVLALITLGIAYGFGIPPRTRRAALLHVLAAGALAAMAAPFLADALLDYVANSERNLIGAGLGPGAPMALLPLSLMLGVPTALFAGIAFALVAFIKPRTPTWSEAMAPLTRVPVVVTDVQAETHAPPAARKPQLGAPQFADDANRG